MSRSITSKQEGMIKLVRVKRYYAENQEILKRINQAYDVCFAKIEDAEKKEIGHLVLLEAEKALNAWAIRQIQILEKNKSLIKFYEKAIGINKESYEEQDSLEESVDV